MAERTIFSRVRRKLVKGQRQGLGCRRTDLNRWANYDDIAAISRSVLFQFSAKQLMQVCALLSTDANRSLCPPQGPQPLEQRFLELCDIRCGSSRQGNKGADYGEQVFNSMVQFACNRLTLFLEALTFCDVANYHGHYRAAFREFARYSGLGWKFFSVLSTAQNLPPVTHQPARLAFAQGEIANLNGVLPTMPLREQQLNVLPDHFAGFVSKSSLGRSIEK